MTKKIVFLGLSGGVDSAVAGLFLKEQGYQVEAVFMKNWESDDNDAYCTAEEDAKDAQKVAEHLNIPLHTVNFSKDYWNNVFEHFLNEYQAGRTPNPDILCNSEIKFKAFLNYALAAGADKIATGHYARLRRSEHGFELLKGLDDNKDQSYFLHLLNQEQLSHSLFPIGELTKPEIRAIAKKAQLPNFAKKDSTGICFIGERRFKQFLSEYLPAKPGIIKTTENEIIGQHEGLMYYTIGQRKGINIGGIKGKEELPWYVVEKDLNENILIITQDTQHPRLFKNSLTANQLHWISGQLPRFPLECHAKIRYRQADQPCCVALKDKQILTTFETPQRAVTPGQSIVFYQEEVCLGGGIIQNPLP